MKTRYVALVAILAALSITTFTTLAQQGSSPELSAPIQDAGVRNVDPKIEKAGVIFVDPKKLVQRHDSGLQHGLAAHQPISSITQASTTGLPTFLFGGGSIVGTLPTVPTTTTIEVDVVPVILNITQGGTLFSFNPTDYDPGCLPDGYIALALLAGSPIFQSVPITMNGVSEGTTQYLDAFQRAELAYVDPNHHTMLSFRTMPAMGISVNVPAGGDGNAAVFALQGTQCGTSSGPVNQRACLG
jgi:hypothetical protein